jgi:hypothetical protein
MLVSCCFFFLLLSTHVSFHFSGFSIKAILFEDCILEVKELGGMCNSCFFAYCFKYNLLCILSVCWSWCTIHLFWLCVCVSVCCLLRITLVRLSPLCQARLTETVKWFGFLCARTTLSQFFGSQLVIQISRVELSFWISCPRPVLQCTHSEAMF